MNCMCEIKKNDCLRYPVTNKRVNSKCVVKMSIIFFLCDRNKGEGHSFNIIPYTYTFAYGRKNAY